MALALLKACLIHFRCACFILVPFYPPILGLIVSKSYANQLQLAASFFAPTGAQVLILAPQ